MSDKPKRKKRRPGDPRPLRGKRKRGIPDVRLPTLSDLDLRTLIVLSVGEWWELGDQEEPPEGFSRWVERADLRQLRGILLAVLARWQELSQH